MPMPTLFSSESSGSMLSSRRGSDSEYEPSSGDQESTSTPHEQSSSECSCSECSQNEGDSSVVQNSTTSKSDDEEQGGPSSETGTDNNTNGFTSRSDPGLPEPENF